jgi:hypothetical protein
LFSFQNLEKSLANPKKLKILPNFARLASLLSPFVVFNLRFTQTQQGVSSDDEQKSPTKETGNEKTGWTSRISRWFSSVRSNFLLT